ncbi:MAG: anti-sigma regulatory factor [Akkermansiaceae bacterium]|nr:anti-sigma regulatory factor [Armatimonadota bacterium]
MTIEKSQALVIQTEQDVVLVRQAVRVWATELQFGSVDQTKIVTASSEIARNTLVYGNGGTATLEIVVADSLRKGLRLHFEDKGPGIASVEQALTNGYSTGGSMGLGFGGAKRLVNEFYVETKLGEGTRVTLIRWK